ncbi:hypothetical protein DNTS_020493 [Danionella cerebrum]|uniref:Uncharacterized protein n=1 Tax=Danionella cerebrum TaxID=2873325 RepID=A0A553QS20_9TELE|nr:hypothetical protein DNTS_020493 [Danionella translucida]
MLVKRSASSSESSEEHTPPLGEKAPANVLQAEPTQTVTTESNESTDSADDTDEDTDEVEDENDTDSSESESEETDTTVLPATADPTMGPDINTGRGDTFGYPSDYKKTIIYMDPKEFEKLPSLYKSDNSDKMAALNFVSKKISVFGDHSPNDVEKEIKVVTALQVHDTPLEDEDTSTPEVDMDPTEHQIGLGSHEIVSAVDQVVAQESDSTGESTSQENEEPSDSSPSSEETTATPGATDSQEDSSQSTESQESDSDEVISQTTEATIIIAK